MSVTATVTVAFCDGRRHRDVAGVGSICADRACASGDLEFAGTLISDVVGDCLVGDEDVQVPAGRIPLAAARWLVGGAGVP